MLAMGIWELFVGSGMLQHEGLYAVDGPVSREVDEKRSHVTVSPCTGSLRIGVHEVSSLSPSTEA